MLKRLYTFLLLTGVFIFSLLYGIYAYKEFHDPVKITSQQTFIIGPNTSYQALGAFLKKKKIISDVYAFYLMGVLYGYTNKLKRGEYAIRPTDSPQMLVEKIARGLSYRRKITFPEGLTVHQIKQRLMENKHLRGEVTVNIEEGDLFPATYDFKHKDTRDGIVLRMRQKMYSDLTKLWQNRAHGLPYKTMREALILASIIEKEAVTNDERATIASVYVNRLKKRMRLQADPTVSYALSKGTGVLGRKLLRVDYKFEHPYNTYRNAGLPPGPICCPGYASIKAALKPAQTNYFYFVAKPDNRGHVFSEKFDDHKKHIRNRRKNP